MKEKILTVGEILDGLSAFPRNTQVVAITPDGWVPVYGTIGVLESHRGDGRRGPAATITVGRTIAFSRIKRMVAREGKFESGRIKKGWAAATEKFFKSPEGADWPGGEQNMMTLGKILEANNQADQPSVENITEAYRLVKRRGLLVR
jgi:hypothetical protein